MPTTWRLQGPVRPTVRLSRPETICSVSLLIGSLSRISDTDSEVNPDLFSTSPLTKLRRAGYGGAVT